MSLLRVGHSPDADDAFMFYALANGKVSIEGYEVQQVLEDIESLNRRAMVGELEVTAISAAAYPLLADKYRIMACGASVGRTTAPSWSRRASLRPPTWRARGSAYPGVHHCLPADPHLPGAAVYPVFLNFDEIVGAVDAGTVDAGLIIHEGQITLEAQGYRTVLDLGVTWGEDTGLPIPLGLDMVHRRLGDDAIQRVAEMFQAGIRYSIAHEDDAVEYALPYGRGIDRETCRRFVRMYVNEDTINMGDEGRRALETLYRRALERGLIEAMPPLDIVGL